MSTLESLKARRSEILQLAERHGARRLRIFGSVARGEDRPSSDIDLLIQLDTDRSLLDHIALVQDLEELLGRRVEIVTERALNPAIRDQVLAEANPL